MEQEAREIGSSGYSFGKLLSLWLNGFTAFSIKPLRMSTLCGGLFAASGFIFAIVTLIRKIFVANIQIGWSSLMSVTLLLSGIILIMLGLIGEYLGRVYLCINQTPAFVIRECLGFDATKNYHEHKKNKKSPDAD